uniref:Cytochrome p450 n=1 Tax=Croton stellatopilosus TaxID=431156 RepID=A0A3G2CJZ2_9ROSI|nr:cytochrome p450 [Croton stellatopilosus]
MFLKLGSIPTVVISSAEMAREIFKNHDLEFSGRPITYSSKKLSYNCSDIALAPYSEKWRVMRKIAIVELLSTKRVQSFEAVRKEEVSLMLDNIANSSGPINLSNLTLLLANNVTCRVAFGRKLEADTNGRLHDLLHEAQELLGGFCVADFFPRMEWLCKFNGFEARLDKNFREQDKLYDKVIQEHLRPNRPEPEQADFTDALLRLQNENDSTLTNDSIKGALMDMFIAGTDTAAATLVWTMTELIRNPRVMKKVQEEVRAANNGKSRVEESDLSKLVYLKSLLKESLRVHPAAPLLVPRETTQNCRIGKYEIPAKTRVLINAASISMDPISWENPGEFQPERFLHSEVDFNGQHFELIPFGFGRRGCPGLNFAVVLIELALANLLHCFDWELPHGLKMEDLDMEESPGITMHKKTHLSLVATPCSN